MAHNSDYSYIYVDTSASPNVGLDFHEDVARCLGRLNTYDEGQLCCDCDASMQDVGKINRWAKYKPIRSPLFEINDSIRQSNNWGFYIPSVGYAQIPALYENDPEEEDVTAKMNGWEYQKPTAVRQNATYKYRILDFDGYYKNARIPCDGGGGGEQTVTTWGAGGSSSLEISRPFNPDTDKELPLTAFSSLANKYFGVLGFHVVNGVIDTNTIFVVSSSTPLSSAGSLSVNVTFNGTNFPATRRGLWYVYPCLCSVGGQLFYGVSGQSGATGSFTPLPCCFRWTFNVVEKAVYGDLQVTRKFATFYLKWRVYNNETSGSKQFTNVKLWALHPEHTPDDIIQSDEWSRVVASSLTVNHGENEGASESLLWTQSYTPVFYLTCADNRFDRVGPVSGDMPVPPEPIPD